MFDIFHKMYTCEDTCTAGGYENWKHGGGKPTETSATEFCYKSMTFSLE